MDDIGPPFSNSGFYLSVAHVQLEFGESAASNQVRLLIKCGFYTRLYGIGFPFLAPLLLSSVLMERFG